MTSTTRPGPVVRELCSAKTADRPRYGIATWRPLNWNDELNLPRVTMCQKRPIGTRHILGDSAVASKEEGGG